MNTYTLKFADGSTLTNCSLNGNNWISTDKIEADFFTDDKLTEVTATGSEGDTIRFTDAFLVQVMQYGDEYWFILAEKTDEQKKEEANSAAMTDVQLAIADLYESMTATTEKGE